MIFVASSDIAMWDYKNGTGSSTLYGSACLDVAEMCVLHRGDENTNHYHFGSNFGVRHDDRASGSAAHAPRARTFARGPRGASVGGARQGRLARPGARKHRPRNPRDRTRNGSRPIKGRFLHLSGARQTGLRFFVLLAHEPKRRRTNDSDDDHDYVVIDEVGINHQRETEEHWFPEVHSFSVHESDEANGSEDDSGDQICRAEVHDIDLLELAARQNCSRALLARRQETVHSAVATTSRLTNND